MGPVGFRGVLGELRGYSQVLKQSCGGPERSLGVLKGPVGLMGITLLL